MKLSRWVIYNLLITGTLVFGYYAEVQNIAAIIIGIWQVFILVTVFGISCIIGGIDPKEHKETSEKILTNDELKFKISNLLKLIPEPFIIYPKKLKNEPVFAKV